MRKVKGFGRDWEKGLEYFILYKKAQGLAERTLSDYRYHVELFFKSTGGTMEDYDELRLSVMQYFAESGSLVPATFNTRRKTLKSFFGWLKDEGIIDVNSMEYIKKRKEEELPRSFKEDVVQRLLGAVNLKTFGGVRDYLC